MTERSSAVAEPDKGVQGVVGCASALLAVFALLGAFVLVLGALSSRVTPAGIGLAVAFLVIGTAGLLLLRWVWVQTVLRERRKALAPDQPWSWDQDIRDRVVKGSSSSFTAVVLSSLAVFWVASTLIVSLVVRPGGSSGDQAQLLALMALPWGAGVFLATAAVVAVRRFMRFGVSNLVLDAIPVRLGGWASGVVQGPVAVQGAEVDVEIRCVRRAGAGRSSHSQILWRTTKVLDGSRFEPRAGRVEIPFAIHLPADPTFADRDVSWHLAVTAKLAGVDYTERFVVPVAAPEPSAPPVDARPPRVMPELDGAPLMAHLPSSLEYHADADVFVFPLKASLILWPLALGAVAIGVLLLHDVPLLAQWPAGVLKWTPIVCGVLAALSMVTLLFDPRRVEIRADNIRIRRGVLGVGVHSTLPVRDVAAVLEESSSDSPPAYAVKIRLRSGKSCDIATTIREPAQSRALATRLRQILQLGDG